MRELLPKNWGSSSMAKNSRNNREFETFKREFKKWQDKFGLLGYHVYFKHEPCGSDSYATINVAQSAMVATAILNAQITAEEKKHRDLKATAKHEAIHLLVHRLENLAYARFLDDSEIVEASEELVRRLARLL